jgi:drug/metabolite transporter (DMT)-like permease
VKVSCGPYLTTYGTDLVIGANFNCDLTGNIAWMAGMKLTKASVAAPLNQLNTIFIFILAAIFLSEKVTKGKIIAVILATIGAILVSWP